MNLSEITKAYDFTGRSIVITGGTGVLGAEIACALLGCGASVTILARNTAPAEALLEKIDAPAERVLVLSADVLKTETLEQAARKVLERFGRVDGLINSAGGNKPEATTGPDRSFFDLSEEALRQVMNLNIMGTILPCRVFVRHMTEQKEGAVVNISSMAAFKPLTRVVGYSAAKAGISNFTQWLAVHLAQEYSPKIRVNAIAPGFFLTLQNRYLLTDRETGELTPRGRCIIAHTPMQRFGQPEELVGAALWLLSPLSAFVTGTVIPIDGGFSAYSGV